MTKNNIMMKQFILGWIEYVHKAIRAYKPLFLDNSDTVTLLYFILARANFGKKMHGDFHDFCPS